MITRTDWGVAAIAIVLATLAAIDDQHERAKNAVAMNEVKAAIKDGELKRRKDAAAVASGLRTEKAQAATDHYFNNLRTEYETEQKSNPGIGCVLDPVSLRRWNDANAQSDGAAPGEPDGGLPAAAPPDGATERSQ
ncbi:hypothetical protein H3H36_10815 [Duganella sp. FT3S]|uniref:Uncharacterized protein n=1 Tax=Rugamonas fusca TaxID=2758568 RepID=A0A7W2EH50_9BURK|nr:hypothetical protein [Rugamonas fusca]MBA5605851.1 hypothetical protein [Rugamonas fusca]